MREIKFRAWSYGRMNYFDNPKEGLLYSRGETLLSSGHDGEDNPTFNGDPDFDLMQFTGLKDKNGREIYEGDVIEYRWLEHMLRGVVLWHDRGGCWLCSNISGGGLPTHGEVIGNIHENPELIHADNQSEGNSTSQEAHER